MKKPGRKPFGHYQDERAVVEVIKLKRRVRRGGKVPGPGEIARELNAEGYKTQTGKQFTYAGIRNILTRLDNSDAQPKKKYATKTQLSSDDYMTPAQVKHALNTLQGNDRLMFETLIGTGLRASEFCDLNIGDIAIKHGKSEINVRKGKGNKRRTVIIPPELKESLRENIQKYSWPNKNHAFFLNRDLNRLTYKNLYYRIKKWSKTLGIPNLHAHQFRHTFAVLLYNYKKDLLFVAQQLGHSKVSTTQIYAKTFNDNQLEQMNNFFNEVRNV